MPDTVPARRARGEKDPRGALRDLGVLASLGDLLDARLDLDATLDGIARLVVEHLAGWCAITMPSPDGVLRTTASASADADVGSLLAEVEERLFSARGFTGVTHEVVRTGVPVLMEEVTPAMIDAAPIDESERVELRAVGLTSGLVVPLVTSGRVLGALRMARFADRPRFDGDDLRLARDIGRRAAVAVDVATLYQAAQDERRRAEEALSRETAAHHDLERAHARVRLLADLGGLLDSSFDVVPALSEVCAMLADQLVDEARIDLVDEPLRGLPSPGSGILAARETRHRLVVAGRPLGTLTVVWPTAGPDPEDVRLLREVTRRISLTIDASRRHTERAAAASTLQASLLPDSLPHIPGIVLAVRYTPAAGGGEVGGDFYDVFPVGDGTWIVAVGDVCGKGVEAASLTAQLRYTLRALGPRRPDPGGLLADVNGALDGQWGHRFASLVVLRLDARAAPSGPVLLDIASAGHPAPFVLRPEGAEVIDDHGPVVGLFADAGFPARRIELGPGAVAVAYTDGISEARHDDVREADRLAADVAEVRDTGPSGVARALESAAQKRAGGELRDDAVVFALAVDAP